ncbi:hydroxyacylglutathione hydrolase [Desulfogranum mediterraneum]|uniref:hydroxyacylglutathione hydrolase n=1 Tax=Desulfogranum mediterraneum TaxID=160661 RepID=UPI0004130042|nr:hydroxyacylglutathione hydrolase [Desulfogranum mediterraneum]
MLSHSNSTDQGRFPEPLVCTVGCLFDNLAYLIICPESRECLLVDPGEYYPLIRAVGEQGLKLRGVCCSHHHRDHIDGLEELLADFPGLLVYGHPADRNRIPGMTTPLADGDTLRVGRLRGQIHHSPGHTRGSCLYRFAGALFTGDTLFTAGCGRLFEGTASEMYHSLQRISRSFSASTRLYPGHDYAQTNLEFGLALEPDNQAIGRQLSQLRTARDLGRGWQPTTLAQELELNLFLRCAHGQDLSPLLIAAGALEPGEHGAELVFAALRALRDRW